ncbi:hypothetical protein [Sphingomonas sp.]|uniref:hypothetical protein n=1 Tax=Sphingomonas sp. TaxID=28214 RepID=UPI001B26867C|nr:hypothetical protein [Sphingomonas sp.]MBO9714900.1 hypothetical protein [Sphingomonas sp.]
MSDESDTPMTEAEPAPESAIQGPGASLAARLGEAVRGFRERAAAPAELAPPASRRDWLVAGAVAALIGLGPVLTIGGATLLAVRARDAANAINQRAAPTLAAARLAEQDRAELAAATRRPGVGAVIEALARALPPEASLSRVGRGGDGQLLLEISSPDPDKLRAALRREPVLAGLRDTGQRQGDGAMVVQLRENAS